MSGLLQAMKDVIQPLLDTTIKGKLLLSVCISKLLPSTVTEDLSGQKSDVPYSLCAYVGTRSTQSR